MSGEKPRLKENIATGRNKILKNYKNEMNMKRVIIPTLDYAYLQFVFTLGDHKFLEST